MARRIALKFQKIDDKLSIVFASLPGSRMEWGVFRDTRDLEQASLYHKRFANLSW